MTLYLTIFILGIIAALALRRVLAALLRAGVMVVVVLFGGRLALIADDRLARPEWMTGAIIGGVAAFVVVGLLCYALIYHALVAADMQRDIERAREQARRRRLW